MVPLMYDETSEAIAAMADHGGAPMTRQDYLADALSALTVLSYEWASATNGTGPDGAFVDVTGPHRQGVPAFPNDLALMLELHVRKQAAYIGANPDPLANYVRAGAPINVTGYQAAFMRMSEKMSRLEHTIRTGVAVDGESVDDTLLDVAVIALLTKQLFKEHR